MPQHSESEVMEGSGRVKACTECRQHKLKCDAHLDYSRSCTRCRKMNLQCVVTRQWKRSKRQSKADLIRENDRLRRQLGGDAKLTSDHVAKSMHHEDGMNDQHHAQPHLINRPISSNGNTSQSASYIDSDLPMASVNQNMVAATPSSSSDNRIDPKQTDECFNLFFAHYARFLPEVFDPDMTPTQYFAESQFLFWTMVSTGARKYTKDPSLLEKASKMLMNFALPSIYSMEDTIPSVKAVLLLCMWPLPAHTSFKDPSYAFAGAAMQIAIQSGLHVVGHEHDYGRTHKRYSDAEKIHRSKLWIHCVIVLQSTNLIGGLPFWMSPGLFNLCENWDLENTVSIDLLHSFKMHQILTTAITALTGTVSAEHSGPGAGTYSMINLFDTQVEQSLPPEASSLNRLIKQCTRLAIRSYHFFTAANETQSYGLLILFNLACKVIDDATALDQAEDLALYSTAFMFRMILLAAYSILKISRSHLKAHLDMHTAEEAMFKAITFIRRRSIQNYDIDSRNAAILNQLWFSTDIFKRKNGTSDPLGLLCRTRLFMSPVFDCCWWWRIEFGGESYQTDNPEPLNEPVRESDTVQPQPTPQLPTTAIKPVETQQVVDPSFSQPPLNPMNNQQFVGMTFDTFPDWEWAAGLSFQNDMNLSLPNLAIQQ